MLQVSVSKYKEGALFNKTEVDTLSLGVLISTTFTVEASH